MIISGYVVDKTSTEKLVNAVVKVENSNYSVYTNEFGYFSISVEKNDTLTLAFSYIGYDSFSKTIICTSDVDLKIELTERNEIEKVVVYSSKHVQDNLKSGTHIVDVERLKLLPSLGGERDILKAIQMLPGIQSGNEGSNGLFVRGGNVDENLILLDGIPIYNVNHIGGFVSIFNPDAITSAEIIKSGFPAKYGGRLSSVLNITTKDGNQNKFSGNFSLSPITSNFSLNGPIKKQKSSFIISARAFYIGWLTKPLTFVQFDGTSMGYNFHDINIKLNYTLDSKNKLFISFFEGLDKYSFKLNNIFSPSYELGETGTSWGNTLGSIRWTHKYASNIFGKMTFAYTKYSYENESHYYHSAGEYDYLYNFKTQIANYILKSDFEWNYSKKLNFEFGSNHNLMDFIPAQNKFYYKTEEETIDTVYRYQKEFALENNLYFQVKYHLNETFSANAGIRITDYLVGKNNYFYVEPRILVKIKSSDKSSIKLSYSETQQNIHLISSSSASLPMDIWTASNSDAPPSYSRQITAGFYKTFGKKKIEFSAETYYKKSTNLVSFKEGATYLSVIGDWTDKLETNGIGKSYGIELLFEKKYGKTTGWISYTLSKTTRQFENINSNLEFPFKYDRRHDFSFVFIHKFSERFNFSANWIYGSGYPYTLPIARYSYEQTVITDISIPSSQAIIYADKNDFRMRAYHRLDLAINFIKNKKRGQRTWSISVYNVYNRQNPYYYFSQFKNGEWQVYQQSLFPIIPSISYSFRFK